MPGHVANSSISTKSTGVLSLLSSTTLATLAFTAEPVHGLMARVMPSPPAGASPLAAGASVAGASVADGSSDADAEAAASSSSSSPQAAIANTSTAPNA